MKTLIIIFINLILILIYKKINTYYDKKYCVEIYGTVVDITIRRSDIDVHFPIVKYKYNEKIYEKQSFYGSNNLKYKKGDSIELKIDPINPSKFLLKDHKYIPISLILVILLLLNILLFISSTWQ